MGNALNKIGERHGELGKRVTLQLLHPGSSRIVHKAANLLVREITLSSAQEQVLDAPRYRHHVEGFSQSLPVPESMPTSQVEEEPREASTVGEPTTPITV